MAARPTDAEILAHVTDTPAQTWAIAEKLNRLSARALLQRLDQLRTAGKVGKTPLGWQLPT